MLFPRRSHDDIKNRPFFAGTHAHVAFILFLVFGVDPHDIRTVVCGLAHIAFCCFCAWRRRHDNNGYTAVFATVIIYCFFVFGVDLMAILVNSRFRGRAHACVTFLLGLGF